MPGRQKKPLELSALYFVRLERELVRGKPMQVIEVSSATKLQDEMNPHQRHRFP